MSFSSPAHRVSRYKQFSNECDKVMEPPHSSMSFSSRVNFTNRTMYSSQDEIIPILRSCLLLLLFISFSFCNQKWTQHLQASTGGLGQLPAVGMARKWPDRIRNADIFRII